jgi:hypothetical protein
MLLIGRMTIILREFIQATIEGELDMALSRPPVVSDSSLLIASGKNQTDRSH